MEHLHQESENTKKVEAPLLHTPPERKKQPSLFGEMIRFTLIALVIVIPIRVFIAQPFIVSGASMEPTFENGEYLIVDQLTYHFETPERGDVIIFRYPRNPSTYFIKRVIGLPGEQLRIDGNKVFIADKHGRNEVQLDESYVAKMSPETVLTETLGEHEYFVMGDNRDASSDSRSWGVLQEKLIIGRALIRLFPITGLGLFPGDIRPGIIDVTSE